LNNDSIIDMVQANVANSVILGQIHSSKTDFNLSPAEVIRLSKAHVPAPVIEAMRNPKAEPVASAVPVKTASVPSKTAPVTTAPAAAPLPVPAPTPVATPLPATLTPTPAPAPVVRPAEKLIAVTVTDGTPILIRLSDDIPADAQPGLALRFTVGSDVHASDSVVIAKGAAVTGEIVEAGKKKGPFGLGGNKMTLKLDTIEAADGHKLNVRAISSRKSDGPSTRPVETGKEKKTKDIAAMAGTEYIAYIEGEQTVSVHKQ
jgi:serine/threonine-protein kinase